MRIGVIAGTPVDTAMGVNYLKAKGYDAVGRYCSNNPPEQSQMQILHKKELAELVIKLCGELINDGAVGIYVNCNSLSGAIDLPYVRKNVPVKMITPLDVYEECAKKYKSIAVIAANCQSLSAIEQVILSQNESCIVYGAGILPLVIQIEVGNTPKEIYDNLKIKALTDHLSSLGGEVFILGCTHFPYILEEIEKNMSMPIINPSDRMIELLLD